MEDKFSINRVKRTEAHLKRGFEEGKFVNAPAAEILGFMWELTREIYSLKGGMDAEQRLQRDVANLVGQRG